MKKKKSFGYEWIYWFSIAVAVIFVYKTLDNINDIYTWLSNFFNLIMPFIIGTLIAYLFYIPCRKLEEIYRKSKLKFMQKRARGLGVITIYILAILFIVIIINFILPVASNSLMKLVDSLPNYYNNAIEYLKNLPEDSIIKKLNLQEGIKKLEQIDFAKILNAENIIEYVKRAIGVASTVFNVFVTLIISVYILLERGSILAFLKKLSKAIFKEETHEKVLIYFHKTNEIFCKFISSQILDSLIVGILMSIMLSMLKVEYGVLLGFIIGLFNIIPYFGAIFAVTISIIITIFTAGFGKAIWVAILIIILQQIDANIINPKIVGDSLEVSPLLIIISITIGRSIFWNFGNVFSSSCCNSYKSFSNGLYRK